MKKIYEKHKKIILSVVAVFLVSFIALEVYIRDDYREYRKEAVPILEYHGIGDPGGWMPELFVPTEVFEQHLKYMHDNGYKMVSVRDMAEAFNSGASTEKMVALTFDDGYEDNYTTVLPLLKKYNATATFFIVHSKIGEYRYMTRQQIQELIDNGMELGSHTINHQILTDIEPKFLVWEIATSKFFMKQDFNRYIVRSLSYPNGQYNNQIMDLSKEYGYYWAVTGNAGTVSKKSFAEKPLELGRIYINDSKGGIKAFQDKIDFSYKVGYVKEHGINIHFLRGL